MAKYLQLDYASNQMYEYSKTAQDGFEAHTNTKGKTSFRQYYKAGVYGTLENVSIRENFKGAKMLGVAMKSLEGDMLYLQFDLFDSHGNIENRFAESIIRHLGNMKKGTAYRIFPYMLSADFKKEADEKEGKDATGSYYPSYGVSIKTANLEDAKVIAKVQPALEFQDKEGSKKGDNIIPNLVWEKDVLENTNRPSAVSLQARNDFLKLALRDAVDGHLQSDYVKEEAPVKEEGKAQAEVVATIDDDDLPF